jgi:DNA polymerase III gamma/tau subunit
MSNKELAIVVSDSLAVKYRPRTIEDMIGNDSAKSMIQGMLKNKKFPNTILLHGGTGM